MWSSDRRKFLLSLGALGGLTACGFEPVYGPGGAGSALSGRITPADPVTRMDYLLVRELETRLGRATGAPLVLDYETEVEEERMAITTDNIATRFNVVGSVTYSLTERASGLVLKTGKVDSFTSYSTTGSTVATQAARRDARERLMVILADLIMTRLYAEAGDLPA
ncbi:MAG: LPS assembly lipoprotein LptE [Pseudooceanicola sp.]